MDLLTRKEAAEVLRVSLRTLDNYVERGLLVPLRGPDGTGGVRFNLADIQGFFQPSTDDCVDASKKKGE